MVTYIKLLNKSPVADRGFSCSQLPILDLLLTIAQAHWLGVAIPETTDPTASYRPNDSGGPPVSFQGLSPKPKTQGLNPKP